MRIGILMCGHAAPEVRGEYGDFDTMFVQLLDGHGLSFQTFDVEAMEFPGGIHDCDGWLLTGSKHGAYEDHPFIPPLEDFVREAHAALVPMVGICFGHQLIAQALGGRVEKWSGGWAMGREAYDFGDQGTLHLNAWHQDQVTRAPDEAKTIARNDFCTHAGLSYGSHIYSVQPHPEFSGALFREYVTARRDPAIYPDALLDDALTRTHLPLDRQAIGDRIARFFLSAREAVHV